MFESWIAHQFNPFLRAVNEILPWNLILKSSINVRFVLEIEIGNEAVSCADDIATLLRGVSNRVAFAETKGNILDENGNTVGSFKIVKD